MNQVTTRYSDTDKDQTHHMLNQPQVETMSVASYRKLRHYMTNHLRMNQHCYRMSLIIIVPGYCKSLVHLLVFATF